MKNFLILIISIVGLCSFTIVAPPMKSTTFQTAEKIEFTLLNKSDVSIPLIIPGVMRPNLSPNSSSGVGLVVGQEILFSYKSKKRVLLIVTEDLAGQEIEVSTLLAAAKTALDKE